VLLLAALTGVCYAAVQLFPLSLLPETVHADKGRTGQAQAGAFTGLWTAAETGALALGPGVFALVLSVSSFRSSDLDEPVHQTGSALTGLTFGFTIVPALLFLLAVPLLLAYRRLAAAHRTTEEAQPHAV
jgi:Na+/melibiose symporter-like transporter